MIFQVFIINFKLKKFNFLTKGFNFHFKFIYIRIRVNLAKFQISLKNKIKIYYRTAYAHLRLILNLKKTLATLFVLNKILLIN